MSTRERVLKRLGCMDPVHRELFIRITLAAIIWFVCVGSDALPVSSAMHHAMRSALESLGDFL